MNCLVVGGAGYIGSHMVKHLLKAGHCVTVFDNLSTGFADAVLGGTLIRGDLSDGHHVAQILHDGEIEAVFHFASSIQVGESVLHPARYYRNNVVNTLTLLDAMVATGTHHIVFSSTAAVYGEPEQIPIPETHRRAPINPYGRTKSMVEDILGDYHAAYGLNSFALRYFNAAGADPDGELGERHDPETHLIPLVLQTASGRRASMAVFGRDYDTPDGTCIRDYIHVVDLASAHEKALQKLVRDGGRYACNLGTGQGYSVAEVIEATERITGYPITVAEKPRRSGDPARLVADPQTARDLIGWEPRLSALDTIIGHAWAWERKCAGLSAITDPLGSIGR